MMRAAHMSKGNGPFERRGSHTPRIAFKKVSFPIARSGSRTQG